MGADRGGGGGGGREFGVLTCLAGVAVLALDEAPAGGGEDGIPDAHRRRINWTTGLSLGRAAGDSELELALTPQQRFFYFFIFYFRFLQKYIFVLEIYSNIGRPPRYRTAGTGRPATGRPAPQAAQ